MPIHRLVVSTKLDTEFVRDRIVNTFHFEHTGALVDMDGLCEDLADVYAAHWGPSRETVVTSYDAQGTKPVYPDGNFTKNPGAAAFASNVPREVALCLSYYADRNIRRHRGRIYFPACFWKSSVAKKPDTSDQNLLLDFADDLAALGGVDVDWVVYSKLDNVARPVTVAWVDDEWDTQRRRGLRPTARVTRAVGA